LAFSLRNIINSTAARVEPHNEELKYSKDTQRATGSKYKLSLRVEDFFSFTEKAQCLNVVITTQCNAFLELQHSQKFDMPIQEIV